MTETQNELVAPERQLVARIELENGVSFSVVGSRLPFTIGRDSGSDFRIPSNRVSRHHCQLYLVSGVLFLKDTSTNGTRINDRRIRQESVSITDRSKITLANETSITLTPCSGTRSEKSRRGGCDRRQGERRQSERRQNVIAVNFERRRGGDRRSGQDRRSGVDRRKGERRATSRS